MKKISLLVVITIFQLTVVYSQSGGADEKVSLEIIDTNSTVKNYEIEWPFAPGPKPIGGEKSFITVVDAILSDNNIDCPPKREKVSENIWMCGNGKKIKTKSNKLAKLLSRAWD